MRYLGCYYPQLIRASAADLCDLEDCIVMMGLVYLTFVRRVPRRAAQGAAVRGGRCYRLYLRDYTVSPYSAKSVVVITEDVQNVHLLLEYRPHINVSLTCEHDPKLQEYCYVFMEYSDRYEYDYRIETSMKTEIQNDLSLKVDTPKNFRTQIVFNTYRKLHENRDRIQYGKCIQIDLNTP
ncbi:hypothetical protein ANN_08089 [Periplaneta americana]|uniref:Uncharacterized protein n=1 Tax=Periplaneta americana TaxID=6978 RepID=A0ABQ8T141_PERAM|nr:hypothetical protein ANN_08089 [Periplaneta americana]